jgi:hypothetical protein
MGSVGLNRRTARPTMPARRPSARWPLHLHSDAGHEAWTFAQAPGSGVASASLRVAANDAAVVTFRLRKEPASAPAPSGDRNIGVVQLVLWAGSFRATRVLDAVVSAPPGPTCLLRGHSPGWTGKGAMRQATWPMAMALCLP